MSLDPFQPRRTVRPLHDKGRLILLPKLDAVAFLGLSTGTLLFHSACQANELR